MHLIHKQLIIWMFDVYINNTLFIIIQNSSVTLLIFFSSETYSFFFVFFCFFFIFLADLFPAMLPRKKNNVTKKVPNITTRSAKKNVDEIVKLKFVMYTYQFFLFSFFYRIPSSFFYSTRKPIQITLMTKRR